MAHLCGAFLAESDAEATPMRHRFGPKRRPFRYDAEKARCYSRLPIAHPCTKVTHAVHSPPGGRGSAKKRSQLSHAPEPPAPRVAANGASPPPDPPAGPPLFHHPRSCQAKFKKALTCVDPHPFELSAALDPPASAAGNQFPCLSSDVFDSQESFRASPSDGSRQRQLVDKIPMMR